MTGLRAPPHWSAPDEPLSLWDLKSVLEDVARRAHRDGATLATGGAEGTRLDPTSSFTVTDRGGSVVGSGGRVREGVVDAPVWAGDIWALELALPAEVPARVATAYARPPSLPSIDRDLALLVPEGVPAGVVADALRREAGALLEALDLFDVYDGKGIPEGMRSLAFRLRFRAAERTLKDEEVDAALRSALERLEEELGVEPRG
jgi:phenylalanyl-tRNA synthetase beta chain